MNIAKTIDITFITGCAFFLCLSFIAIQPSLNTQIILLLIGSLIIGLPHGAMDYEVGKHLGLCQDVKGKAFFFLTYIAIACLNFGLWVVYPLAGFLLFLILSIFHFSEDWNDADTHSIAMTRIRKLSFACAFLSLPTLIHTDQIQIAFSLLISDNQASVVVGLLKILAIPLFILTSIFVIRDFIKRHIESGSLALSFILSAIFLPPIIFLFLYFCLLHGPRHTLELYQTLNYKSFSELLKRNVAVIGLTALALLFVVLFRDAGFDMLRNTFSTLIIFIACLTTPHMILIFYLKKYGKSGT